MNVTNVGTNTDASIYGSKESEKERVREKVSDTDTPKQNLGVLVQISSEGEEASKMIETMKNVRGNGYDIGERKVIFHGVGVTKEQGDKLKSFVDDLEKQGYISATPNESGSYEKGDEALGASWEPGTYAQMGLKVSQLSYYCKELGLSDDETEAITKSYGNRQGGIINKTNNLWDVAKRTLDEIRPEFQKMQKAYGINQTQNNNHVSDFKIEDSVELNKKTNAEIYNKFSTLDTSDREKFAASFERAMDKLKNYFNDNPIEKYTGTDREKRQLDELEKRFSSFFEKYNL